jgi:hypothetical protein
MGIRGPQSGAALAIASVTDPQRDARPEPPEDLTEEQSAEWEAVVARLPADWFPRETQGLLAQYCRHVVTARRLARMLAELEAQATFDIRDYDRLLKAQERETRCLASLATRMRISQQSSYDKKRIKPDEPEVKPWEFRGN